jgi:hypothetical protein
MCHDRNQLKIEVENLIEKYRHESQQIDENDSDDDVFSSSQLDNNFVDSLIGLFLKSIFKGKLIHRIHK